MHYFSDRQFLNVALDLWVAGMETTITTLKWAFLYLLHNPEVQEKIHKELDEVIGEDREITMTDKPNLPYITATINVSRLLSGLQRNKAIVYAFCRKFKDAPTFFR